MFDNTKDADSVLPAASHKLGQLLYVHQNVYVRAADGTIYAEGQFDMRFWAPFLAICDRLVIASHCRDALSGEDLSRLNCISDPKISFLFLPRLNSLTGLTRLPQIRQSLRQALQQSDLLVIRTYSEAGWQAFKLARKLRKPYVLEMAGCPFDNTWHHGHVLARPAAPLRMLRTQHIARTALGVLYVTRDFLPRRYPSSGIKAVASNVRLGALDASVLAQRTTRSTSDELHIGLIGGLNHKLKGIPVAIQAIALARDTARDQHITLPVITLHLLGQGNPAPLQKLADSLGVRLQHDGMLPAGQAVFDWLDALDLYLQPSFHEGLPRATLEAMSRALPVLVSTAGGLPEILPQTALHKPGDIVTLANQLLEFAQYGQDARSEQGLRNYQMAANFTADKLEPVRNTFWQNIVSRLCAS